MTALRRPVSNEAWVKAHVMVTTESYGIDLPLLAAAIERYAGDPASRAGLSVPRLRSACERS